MPNDEIETSPIDILFQNFTKASDETDVIREGMINRLNKQLPDIHEHDSARDIEVKMGIYKTLDDLLKSKESSKANRVKMQLQRKDVENTANYQEAVITLLDKIDPSRIMSGSVKNTDIDQELNKKFEESGQSPILPGECQLDS